MNTYSKAYTVPNKYSNNREGRKRGERKKKEKPGSDHMDLQQNGHCNTSGLTSGCNYNEFKTRSLK